MGLADISGILIKCYLEARLNLDEIKSRLIWTAFKFRIQSCRQIFKILPNCSQLESGLTIGDDKLGGLAELLNLTLLVELVRLLVVDEQVGGALACHPALKDLLVLRLLEGILRTSNNSN